LCFSPHPEKGRVREDMLRSSALGVVWDVMRPRGRAAMTLPLGLLAVMAAFLVLFFVAIRPVQAAPTTFTVNSTADDPLGSDPCDATECTLREAINAANSNGNPTETDAIAFRIPGTGPHIIELFGGLPQISQAVSINGYTEHGSSANTLVDSRKGTNAKLMIDVDGSSTSNSFALDINTPNVVVKGLAIHSFDGGILVGSMADNLRIEGNFIGTDPGGIQDKGIGGDGVAIASAANITVGGDAPAARNLISGNDGTGVSADSTTSTEVEGNLIGTQKNGTSPLPNVSDGVSFNNAGDNNSVGGLTVGSANTIAYNGANGVLVFGGQSVYVQASVLRNSIFSNGAEGISLPLTNNNDPGDTDTGANGGQNSPVISTAKTSSRATTIVGTLNSNASQGYTLMFFSNPPVSSEEAKTFKVQKSVTTDGAGNASFSFSLKRGQKIPVGQFVTATATAPNGDTSEFSVAQEVVR
jgi:CSLREA domain-containing protein